MKITIRQLFFLILVLGLFFITLRPVADPDFWWHLKTGELIFQTRSIPHVDPFSFTRAGSSWVTHEWLAELLIFGLFQIGSYGLLVICFSMVIVGSFLLAYLRTPENSRPYVAGFVLLLGALATAPTWGVRPQMFSLLFTSLFLLLLDRYERKRNPRYLIPLPFLITLWVNLHAGYFLGLAVIGIFILGNLVELLIYYHQNNILSLKGVPQLKSVEILCISLGACVLASLVNPNGLNILFYPFKTLTSPSMQQLIQEWLSPDFHQIIWQPLALILLALLGLGLVGKKTISATNVLLVLVFGYATLLSMRNVPFFALCAIPVLTDQVDSFVKIQIEPGTPSRLTRLTRIFGPILLLFLTAAVILRFVQVVQSQPKVEADDFPVAAVNWLVENNPKPNLFNSYGWGGYIIWKTFPQYRVYIDGRADVYGDAFIFNYLSIYKAETDWENKLLNQDIHTVLVENNSPLANMLQQSPGWALVFKDKTSVIYTR